MSTLKFNTGVLSTLEEELSIKRWKNKETYQIVTECVKNDYLTFLHDLKQSEDFSVEELYESISKEIKVDDSKLGALSIEGKKILELQNLIEEKILRRPSTDTSLTFSGEHIEVRFILLRNELLFERYLQKQVCCF